MRLPAGAALLVAATLPGAVPPAAGSCGPVALAEEAAAAGLRFRHERGAAGAKHLPETMGAGLAWLDADGDGWLDLYLVQSGPFPPSGGARSPDRLFRNLGVGRFEEAPAAGASDLGYGQGVVAADADGDGDVDLYLTNYGRDRLLVNGGDGRFVDGTAAAGLGLDGWSSSAAFADADGDGDLDLYVTRYLVYDPQEPIFCGDPDGGGRTYCDPSLFAGETDRFYRNGGGATFRDATEAAGLAGADGRGLGVVFTDLDGDRRPDLYVANDLTLNLLFRNLGEGRFADESLVSGAAVNRDGVPEAGMGIAVADLDDDLDPEIAVTNFDVETNTLYRNLGGLAFEDVSAATGFGPPSLNLLAFGIAAEDFDGDGRRDLYVATGHIFERPKRENVAYRQRDQLFLGTPGGLAEVRCAALEERATVARGLAAADADNDGDPDLAIQENGGELRYLRSAGAAAAWLGVSLVGAAPNTGAVGATATLAAAGRLQIDWARAGDSYQSSSDPRLRFRWPVGEPARELQVGWPGGAAQRFIDPPAGAYLRLFEPPTPGPSSARLAR